MIREKDMQETLTSARKLLSEQVTQEEVNSATNQLIMSINSIRNQELFQRARNSEGERDIRITLRSDRRQKNVQSKTKEKKAGTKTKNFHPFHNVGHHAMRYAGVQGRV